MNQKSMLKVQELTLKLEIFKVANFLRKKLFMN